MISLKSAWRSDDAEAHSDWCRHDVVGCDDNGPHSLAEKVDKDFLGLEKSVGLPSTTGNTWFCEILPSTMGC